MTVCVCSHDICVEVGLIRVYLGVYAVRFMPYEAGVYFIHVKFNGAQIRGSPFRVRVGKDEADPAQVHAYGKGLESTQAGEKAEFVVDTLKAGAGTLAVRGLVKMRLKPPMKTPHVEQLLFEHRDPFNSFPLILMFKSKDFPRFLTIPFPVG